MAAAAFLAVLAFGVSTAAAGSYGEAPWCAVINTGTGDVHWDCQFRSAEQCAPFVVAGNRGFCNINPRYVAPAGYAAPAKYRRRHS